jgi:hypothetical protein
MPRGFAAGFGESIPTAVTRVRVGICCAGLLFVAILARAAPLGSDGLRAAADADEVALARIAAHAGGDDVVIAALSDSNDPLAQLAAIRATPYIVDKDQAVLPLAALAASRDPELAPLAAWKLVRVVQDLVREGLVVREVSPRSLAPARAALLALVADATARSDIRLYAGQAAQLLGSLGVPASESPATPRLPGNEPSASNSDSK